MTITNFKKLAKTPLRKKALEIAEAGYEAINIGKAVNEKFVLKNGVLTVEDDSKSKTKINFNDFKNVYFVGVGKGSALGAAAIAKILGKYLTKGISLDVVNFKSNSPKLAIIKGTHPLASAKNVSATAKIIKLAKQAKKDDLVIVFVCGGGSALLCGSKSELKHNLAATKLLTAAGADILELNTVRKHVSQIKAGNLAKLIYPATAVSLIVSDVVGNGMSMIASGPTVKDKTTKKDAERVLKKYRIDPKRFGLIETPKDDKYFKHIRNILFVSNKTAVLAMAQKARELKLKPKIKSLALKGEARKIFDVLAGKSQKRGVEVVLAAGETTVRIKTGVKTGKGGRNQESVLSFISYLNNNKRLKSWPVFVSFASDSHDNTEAAGAVGDYLTVKKAVKLGLNPWQFLGRHDSFNFFKKTGDLIFAKKECFNVADLMIFIAD